MNKYKMKWTIGVVILMILSVGIFAFAYNQIIDSSNTSNTSVSNSVFTGTESANTKLPLFDAETLKAYNGKDNQPSYIAYKGTVYDVSDVKEWQSGTHHGVEAGMDLTELFSQSPHSESILKEAQVVGVYTTKLLSTIQTDVSDATALDTVQGESVTQATTPSAIAGTSTNSSNTTTVFNASSLKAFNGKNNQPAYIAVSGIVYDVTNVSEWRNGTHNGYSAGQDLTNAFAMSPHSQSLLSTLKIVGTYEEKIVAQSTGGSSTTTQNTQSTTQSNVDSGNIITLAQLATFNGQNNQPAYIAVNGVVYDVTSYWKNGQHHGLTAGADMTSAFISSPHSSSLLAGLPIVGYLPSDQTIVDQSINTKTGSDEDEHDDYDDDHEEDEYEDDEHEDDD